jgi:hypothetical protein
MAMKTARLPWRPNRDASYRKNGEVAAREGAEQVHVACEGYEFLPSSRTLISRHRDGVKSIGKALITYVLAA